LVLACSLVFAVASTAAPALAAQGAAIVVDAKTGKVLYSSNPDARRYPASLTKMMTLYLLFEAIESGKTKLTSRITVSSHAAAQAPSKLGVKPGDSITVKEAILAIVTKSANDVAVAIGEYLAGSESDFAARMTAKARALGMSRTVFRNASGLPDPGQVTTARDMATLGRALQDNFPREFAYFSTSAFTFKGRRIGNHNRLLGRIAGVNGIKTGYTRASGYNLVTSVNRDGRLVVAVVLGGASGRARDQRMASLITDYLPKASAGAKKVAVVAAATPSAPAPVLAAASTSPAASKLAGSAKVIGGALADASAAPLPRKRPAAGVADPVDTGSVELADATPIADLNTEEGDGGDDSAGPDAPAAPAMVPAGWKIQLAASPTQAAANSILEKALASAPKALSGVSPYTEPVSKGDSTLFRARFAGFASKDAAWKACAALSKQKFSCLALQ
ncbi:MAG TPA: D-alanyl-D-alanine carboxypeptidase, partial [Bauldia sp.]|nr:D-alanyl-D-alanine carboxypeptidase [Bauldia sp.]